jgi:predicted site-specific integrase-resolvase
LIGVSRASIFRWIKAGKIRAIRLGDRAVRVAVPREIAEGAWAANESAAERAR